MMKKYLLFKLNELNNQQLFLSEKHFSETIIKRLLFLDLVKKQNKITDKVSLLNFINIFDSLQHNRGIKFRWSFCDNNF